MPKRIPASDIAVSVLAKAVGDMALADCDIHRRPQSTRDAVLIVQFFLDKHNVHKRSNLSEASLLKLFGHTIRRRGKPLGIDIRTLHALFNLKPLVEQLALYNIHCPEDLTRYSIAGLTHLIDHYHHFLTHQDVWTVNDGMETLNREIDDLTRLGADLAKSDPADLKADIRERAAFAIVIALDLAPTLGHEGEMGLRVQSLSDAGHQLLAWLRRDENPYQFRLDGLLQQGAWSPGRKLLFRLHRAPPRSSRDRETIQLARAKFHNAAQQFSNERRFSCLKKDFRGRVDIDEFHNLCQRREGLFAGLAGDTVESEGLLNTVDEECLERKDIGGHVHIDLYRSIIAEQHGDQQKCCQCARNALQCALNELTSNIVVFSAMARWYSVMGNRAFKEIREDQLRLFVESTVLKSLDIADLPAMKQQLHVVTP